MSDQNIQSSELQAIPIPNPFLSFAINHWQLCLLLAGTIAFAATFYVQKLEIKHYKNVIEANKNEIKRLSDNNETLSATIDDQNKKIKAAKDSSDSIMKQLDDLQKTIKTKEITNQNIINKLKQQPTPKGCTESLDYLNKILEGGK